MYCPKCNDNTHHADHMDGTYCCLICHQEHPFMPPPMEDKVDYARKAANDDGAEEEPFC